MLMEILPVRVIYLTDILALTVVAKSFCDYFLFYLFCPDISSLRSWEWNFSALSIGDNIGGSIFTG